MIYLANILKDLFNNKLFYMKYIIISGSSDIGSSIINNLNKKNNKIVYTYNSKKNKKLKKVKAYKLDISSRKNIKKFASNKDLKNWDCLVILPASQDPIGLFSEASSEDWAKSVDLNFTNQMYIIRELIPHRSKKNKIKSIMLWAGPGTNNAPKYYSAYIISKVAQIKMTELLDAEFNDIKVSIIGPGWVKTKIHKQTLNAKKLSRDNYQNTIDRFKNNQFNSMKDVIACFNKILKLDKDTVGGRNFSVEFDQWRSKDLVKILNSDKDIYKLRRDFNEFRFTDLNFEIPKILDLIYENKNFQNPNSLVYKTFKRLLNLKYTLNFLKYKKITKFLNFNINFPYIKLGNINSIHLFGIDELLIFKFYLSRIKKYKKVCDIGANIGLHSLILSKCGYKVDAYEPDPVHCQIAKKIFKRNRVQVNLQEKAVSNYSGTANFTRIVNNTTGSYISNKKTSYGPIKKLKVKVINATELSKKYDLIKIDAEGSEFDILSQFTNKDFKKTDFIIEISTASSRNNLWKMIKEKKLKVYSQKISWNKAKKIEELPSSHREGSVFISSTGKI